MARTIGSDGEKTQNAIREAAVRLIARRGFEAVSMRLLAAEVGVQAAALYRYFPNKEALLFSLMREHMRGLTAAWETARPAGGDPAARLAAFTANHIRFHVGRRHSTHVSNMELRSLGRPQGCLGDAFEDELQPGLPVAPFPGLLKQVAAPAAMRLEIEAEIKDRLVQDALRAEREGDQEPAQTAVAVEKRMNRPEPDMDKPGLDEGRHLR